MNFLKHLAKNYDFDDTKPSIVKFSLQNMIPFKDALDFFRFFGDVEVEISDKKGSFVKKSNLGSLIRWWNIDSNKISLEVFRGYVVHWPISKINHVNIIENIIRVVTDKITSFSPHLKCIFDRYDFKKIPNFQWTIIGPSGLNVKAHQDMFGTASWNLLFLGKKEWFFWEPEKQKVKKHLPFLRLEQNPGDMVWIPENWWHSVKYLEPSICFSKNLILRRSLKNILVSMNKKSPKYAYLLKAVLLIEKKRLIL